MWAASGGHVDVMQWLVSDFALSPNATNRVGRSAIMFACKYRHMAAVRWLVEQAGCDLSLRSNDGTSVFEWAVYGGSLEVINYLAGLPSIQIHSKNGFGCGAVHWAAAR